MGRKRLNIPPRLQSNAAPRRIKPRNLPPRILNKLRQERQAKSGFGDAISSIARPIPVEYPVPCWFDLVMLQRASMDHFAMSQQQVLMQQRAVMREKEFRVQEERRKRASVQRLVMLQQQSVMMVKQFQLQEEQRKKKDEEKKLAEESTMDYSKLTPFLEKDDSFLTPWNWKPRKQQPQPRRTEPYFSFNVRERWASEKKKDIEANCN